MKRRRAAQLALESQVAPLTTPVYQPPVNAYQQPQAYVQQAYPPQYPYTQPPPYQINNILYKTSNEDLKTHYQYLDLKV